VGKKDRKIDINITKEEVGGINDVHRLWHQGTIIAQDVVKCQQLQQIENVIVYNNAWNQRK
jgi:hypothetical protein